MKERTLSTKDVCKLIVACKKNGVTKLSFGDLELSLDNPAKIIQDESPQAAIPDETFLKAQEEKNKLDVDKDDTALLLIEDPLEMERRIGNGELIDEVSEH